MQTLHRDECVRADYLRGEQLYYSYLEEEKHDPTRFQFLMTPK